MILLFHFYAIIFNCGIESINICVNSLVANLKRFLLGMHMVVRPRMVIALHVACWGSRALSFLA